MKIPFLPKWLVAALWVLAFGATAARAEPDTFYLGNGHDGAFSAPGVGTIVNGYAQVLAPLAAGDTGIEVAGCTASPCFAAGDLVMVLQTTGFLGVPPIEDPAPPTPLGGSEVGHWELARVSAVAGTTVTLSAPLVRAYAAQVTQLIRVPEFTTVTVELGNSIVARPWDGQVGGVLAFLATGDVRNQGELDASGAGFRGGVFVRDTSGATQCGGTDEAVPKGAQKGEGLANLLHGATHTGRGYALNGGGGGVCFRSGGGGGANHGRGGRGGFSASTDGARSVGGQGGAPLRDYSLLQRFVLGGGGGAGHGSLTSTARGGQGGGLLFIRAWSLSGTGGLSATGASGYFGGNSDAAGGGGAGGSIHLRFATTASCKLLDATGGTGGGTNGSRVGPGGGGGGGAILVQAAHGGNCSPDADSVSGAGPGVQKTGTAPGGLPYGAEAGALGRSETIDHGFVVPAVPTVRSPGDHSFTNNPLPNVSGTATPNTSVVVFIDGREVGRGLSNAAGNYVVALDESLGEGVHSVRAATEVEGIQSPGSAANTFTVDFHPPPAPAVTVPAGGAFVSALRPTLRGTAEPDSTVWVYLDIRSPVAVTASPTGAWTYTPDFDLSQGAHAVKATATDRAGNTGPESPVRSFTVDTVAPAAPRVTTPVQNAVSNNKRPVFTGTTEPGTTVTVYLEGAVLGTAVVTSGTWRYELSEDLADKAYKSKATATDAAGNISPDSTIHAFTIDTKPPAAPIVSTPTEGAYVKTRAPVLTGTAEAGSTVTVFVDLVPVGVTSASAAGQWTFTAKALMDGPRAVKVTATDAANNTSPESNTRTFLVDATAPDAPAVTSPAEGVLLATRINVLTGTAEAGTTVTVFLGTTAVGTAPVDATGHWSFTTAELADGTYAVKVTATDTAGNASPESSPRTFHVDATAPEAPVVLTPEQGARVADARPVFTGTAEAGSHVTVHIDAKAEPVWVTADDSGHWRYTPTTDLADGAHTVTAEATDAAGNASPVSAGHDFTVDTHSPETSIDAHPPAFGQDTAAAFSFHSDESPVTYRCTLDGESLACGESLSLTVSEGAHTLTVRAVDALGNEDATPASFSWTVDAHPPETPGIDAPEEGAALESSSPVVLRGTAEPGSTVTLLLDGQEHAVTADASGHWSFTLDTPDPGPHQVTARATDAAGNTSTDSAPRGFTVLDSARRPDTELSSGPPATTAERDATFTFGSREPGATFECELDGAGFTPCTSPVSYSGLEPGEHTFQVRAVDGRGFADATPESRTWTVEDAPGGTQAGEGASAYLGGGFGCSATGGGASLVWLCLGSLLKSVRRRRAVR